MGTPSDGLPMALCPKVSCASPDWLTWVRRAKFVKSRSMHLVFSAGLVPMGASATLSSHLFSLSLLLASLIPKLTHNRVVEFEYRSIGKGSIRLCP